MENLKNRPIGKTSGLHFNQTGVNMSGPFARCSAGSSFDYGTWWDTEGQLPKTGVDDLCEALRNLSRPVFAVDVVGSLGVANHGQALLFPQTTDDPQGACRLLGYAPPLLPENLPPGP